MRHETPPTGCILDHVSALLSKIGHETWSTTHSGKGLTDDQKMPLWRIFLSGFLSVAQHASKVCMRVGRVSLHAFDFACDENHLRLHWTIYKATKLTRRFKISDRRNHALCIMSSTVSFFLLWKSKKIRKFFDLKLLSPFAYHLLLEQNIAYGCTVGVSCQE